jgi:hypothetical protein
LSGGQTQIPIPVHIILTYGAHLGGKGEKKHKTRPPSYN